MNFKIITSTKNLLKSVYSIRYQSSNAKQKLKYPNDVIGPPDKKSNLRPIIFYKRLNETSLQKEYRELRTSTQNWNQKFWSDHNQNFVKEREEFIKSNKKPDQASLNADEMSIFYKKFLDKNWKTHTSYNIRWYKKNITIFSLAIRIQIENFINKMKS